MQLQRSGAELYLHWLPQLQNKKADALTNGCFAAFSMERRLHFDMQEFTGIVLQDLLKPGLGLFKEIHGCRAANDAPAS